MFDCGGDAAAAAADDDDDNDDHDHDHDDDVRTSNTQCAQTASCPPLPVFEGLNSALQRGKARETGGEASYVRNKKG